MCGIGGIIRIHPRPHAPTSPIPPHADRIPDAWLDILDESIAHRGPDGNGRFRASGIRAAPDIARVEVALVHRRLAIIDSATGAQPMVTPAREDWLTPGHAGTAQGASAGTAVGADAAGGRAGRGARAGQIAVVFNGCVYNHRALRAELTALGHRFATHHSDTECIAHAYREWGLGAFRRLEGMFAVALWHSGTNAGGARLVLARDLAGEKPLYFARIAEGCAAFCSSAAGLVRLCARVRRENAEAQAWSDEISEHALATWVSQGFATEMPLWCVHEADPAAVLTEREIGAGDGPGGDSAAAGAWQDEEGAECGDGVWTNDDLPDERSFAAALTPELLDDLIAESVRERLEADVPLGCFLSGGTDSSLVASHAMRTLGKLTTLTLRMPGSDLDESDYARRVAEKLRTSHVTADAHPARAADDLERLIGRLGLPFGDSSLLAAHWISRAARDAGLRVALSGDGGDELFLGYDRYRGAEVLRRWRWAIRMVPDWVAALAERGSPRTSASARARRLVRAAKRTGRGYADLVAILQAQEMDSLGLRVDGRAGFPGMSVFGFGGGTGVGGMHAAAAARWDFFNYLPQNLLRKTDTASMDVALEVRCPLLSRRLISAALREPESSLTRGGRKGLLREVARRHVGADIIDRPKRGFALPVGLWLRTPGSGIRELLLDRMSSAEAFGPPWLGIEVNMGFVKRLIDEHEARTADHAQKLWTLLATSLWCAWLAKACASETGARPD